MSHYFDTPFTSITVPNTSTTWSFRMVKVPMDYYMRWIKVYKGGRREYLNITYETLNAVALRINDLLDPQELGYLPNAEFIKEFAAAVKGNLALTRFKTTDNHHYLFFMHYVIGEGTSDEALRRRAVRFSNWVVRECEVRGEQEATRYFAQVVWNYWQDGIYTEHGDNRYFLHNGKVPKDKDLLYIDVASNCFNVMVNAVTGARQYFKPEL